MSESHVTADSAPNPAAEKVKSFPTEPGVYLMKDAEGRVIYVGKAKNLRSRASSYFTAIAAEEHRTKELVKQIVDIDYIITATEVDALLKEARLIKDIQPKFNSSLKDDKSFPYLQIRIREEFPRVEFTRKPRRKGVKLYGPFTSARSLRAGDSGFAARVPVQDLFAGHSQRRSALALVSTLLAAQHSPVHGPLQLPGFARRLSQADPFLAHDSRRQTRPAHPRDGSARCSAASAAMQFEKAAKIRDEIASLQKLELRGDADKDAQPEVFHIDPRKGLLGLRKVLKLKENPRIIEGIDIAHLQGQDTVASLVNFLDGLPFKTGYRKFKLKSVEGIDDFASMREVVVRRYRRGKDDNEIFPDILLIDGGKGQLNAALDAFRLLGIEPPCLISLAKQEEEIFRPGESESIKLSRHSAALRLLQYVRDEAHRFAQHYHHQLRQKRLKEG